MTSGVVLLALLAACTSTVSGVPLAAGDHPAGTPAAALDLPVTAQGYDAAAAAYAQVREIDPCALHHLPAAQEATGMTPDSIMPGEQRDMTTCRLEMTPGPQALSIWQLTTSITAEKPVPGQGNPEKFGDITAVKHSTGKDEARQCEYGVDLGRGRPTAPSTSPTPTEPTGSAAEPRRLGISLIVQRNGLDAQPHTACQVAQTYLRAVGKYWLTPARYTDHITTPHLSFARINPCAGLGRLDSTLGGKIEATLLDPHSCSIRTAAAPGSGPAKPSTLKIQYSMETDPRSLLRPNATDVKPTEEHEAISVAGRPGVLSKPKAAAGNAKSANPKATMASCTARVISDEKLILQLRQGKADSAKTFPVIVSRADSCEVAIKAAEAAQPGRPAPPPAADNEGGSTSGQRMAGRQPNSLALGDLNRPPSAADVKAPFDPCSLGWEWAPPEVRSSTNSAPTLLWPKKDELFDVICEYDNSGTITVSVDPGGPPPSGPEGGYLLATVAWQAEPGGDPTGQPKAQPATFAGNPGYLQDLGTHEKLGPRCLAELQLSRGAAVVFIANSRFPQAKPCDLAKSLAEAIAKKST